MNSLCGSGSTHAGSLVASGNVDKTSSWSFSAEDGNAMLGANGDDWANYASWHMGVNGGEPMDTKAHWSYPFGKGGKVFRAALVAIKQRAAQQGDAAIEARAATLLDKVDGKAMRAYATLTLKGFAEAVNGQRTFDGIASTPAPDRMGDIVEPMGAKFKLPIPLLYQHDAQSPIGHITEAAVTPSGIRVKGVVQALADPPTLKERLDVAWAEIKAGLVRGLSIGFNPLDMEPLNPKDPWGSQRFKSWEWLELSAVTIPANQDASITTIKSIDERMRKAVPGRSTQASSNPPPGASGKPAARPPSGGPEAKGNEDAFDRYATLWLA